MILSPLVPLERERDGAVAVPLLTGHIPGFSARHDVLARPQQHLLRLAGEEVGSDHAHTRVTEGRGDSGSEVVSHGPPPRRPGRGRPAPPLPTGPRTPT